MQGSNRPGSIGMAASHGCIRMRNRDVEELFQIVKVGTPVNIWGGVFGPFGNGFRVLTPGDRGSDVYEVQKVLKREGYYAGYVDGIYGEGMKASIIKFRKDMNLPMTHDIDWGFYKALGIDLFE
ncbi:MAG: L,D-transpeptidase family protein [Bacillota bacterium]